MITISKNHQLLYYNQVLKSETLLKLTLQLIISLNNQLKQNNFFIWIRRSQSAKFRQMKNIEIRKRLKMGSQYSIYDRNQHFKNQNLVISNQLIQKIIKKINKDSITLKQALNTYKKGKQYLFDEKSTLNNSISRSLVQKQNNIKRYQNSNALQSPGSFFIRQKPSTKQYLVPKPLPSQIKQLQTKIKQLQIKQDPNKMKNKLFRGSRVKRPQNLSFITFYQNFQGKTNHLNHQINQTSQQNKPQEWYIKAIETHLKDYSYKGNINQGQTQRKFHTKIMVKEPMVGKLPQRSNLKSGFKKRAASYEIKYL